MIIVKKVNILQTGNSDQIQSKIYQPAEKHKKRPQVQFENNRNSIRNRYTRIIKGPIIIKANKRIIIIQKLTYHMESNNEIFLNSEEHIDHTSPEEIKYIHNTESDDYISQFLWEEGSQELSRLAHESAPLFLQKIPETIIKNERKPQNQKKKPKRQKSLFHNFQKHLVITLKKIVHIRARPEDGLVGKVAEDMWGIFVKSHLYTKTILHILYGAEQQEEECSFTSAMLNRFGYVDLFNKYSEDLVKEGQEYLRKQTVRALEKTNIKQYLNKRRLSKSQQFEEYLKEFIEELRQGPIKRRIPKQKKQNLRAYQKSLHKTSSSIRQNSRHEQKQHK